MATSSVLPRQRLLRDRTQVWLGLQTVSSLAATLARYASIRRERLRCLIAASARSDGTLRHRRLPARVLYLRNFRASQIPEVHLLLFEIVVNVGDLGRCLDASDDDFRLFLITRRHP